MTQTERAPRPQPAEAPPARPARGALAAFGIPAFRWHWSSTLASFTGMQMQGVALGILSWELTHSYAVVGILQAAWALPMALLALPGGALVDRLEKRRLIAASQMTLGLFAVLTAFLVQVDLITVALLFIAGLVQGAMFSVNGPARTALVAEVVPVEVIPAAMSMQTIAMNGTRIAAPALAGVLIALVSIAGSYYVAAAMYAASTLAILRVTRSRRTTDRPKAPLLREMRAGVRYVFGSPLLRSLLLSGLVVALFVMPYQLLLPGFADELGHSELFGPMIAVSGVGGLLGSFTAASLATHPRKRLLQILLGLASGASLIALGLLPGPLGIIGAFVALAAVGFASTGCMTMNQTMLMTEADGAFRGRVMSLSMLTFSAMPLMALPLGALADVVGGDWSFAAEGVIAIAAFGLLALANRRYVFIASPAPGGDPHAPPARRPGGMVG